LAVNKSNRPHRLTTENDLFVFERRDALNAILISGRCECGLHSCARVCVVLNSEPRRNGVRATGADETRVVESHHDHDAIADDPFVDGSQ
jgi:hypothetical protein